MMKDGVSGYLATSEGQMLLACARRSLSAPEREMVSGAVRAGIDWGLATAAAERHGLLPLLCTHVEEVCPDLVPGRAMEELREKYERYRVWSAQQYAHLSLVLAMLSTFGIPAIPLKGPVLALALYGELSLRQSGDLDLLIQRPDFDRAKSVMLSLGFRPVYQLSPEQERRYLASECEYPMGQARTGQRVELQWDFVPAYFSLRLPVDRFWERAETARIAGLTVRSLRAEDTLLTLCVHGGKHAWSRLAWLCDVAELVRAGGIDWDRVGAEAKLVGAERMLSLGLLLAAEMLAAPVPGPVLLRAQGDRAAALAAARLRHQLLDPEARPLSLAQQSLYHLRMRERWGDRVRYCLRMALTPSLPEFGLLAAPRGLGWLYTLVRPFRLARQYLPSLCEAVLSRGVA